jgi:hypothetical protein
MSGLLPTPAIAPAVCPFGSRRRPTQSRGPSQAEAVRGLAPARLLLTYNLFRSEVGPQFLLGHESILTTERYLGSEQDLKNAVNHALVFE